MFTADTTGVIPETLVNKGCSYFHFKKPLKTFETVKQCFTTFINLVFHKDIVLKNSTGVVAVN